MSPEQRRFFYFPAWQRVAKALDWRMENNRLKVNLDAQLAESNLVEQPAREELVKVIGYAQGFAARQHRAETADDLRHACNYIASAGKTIHTEDMDNHATTVAVRLFRLLADPLDLSAVGDWLNPDEADRKDQIAYLKRIAHEAALIAIAKNTWGTSDWAGQGLEQLRWLGRQVSQRNRSRRRTFARATETQPF